MQNTVNQNKQTRAVFLQSTTSYLFRFGNYRGNGLVTQILLYLAISCFLTKQQIRAFQLIINELRFIRCVSLVTVSAVITHVGRHTYATMLVSLGGNTHYVKDLLGHSSLKMTERYVSIVESSKRNTNNLWNNIFDEPNNIQHYGRKRKRAQKSISNN